MKKGNKILAITLGTVLAMSCLAGCGKNGSSDGFDDTQEIAVVSREEGSGTRGAFVELTGVEEKRCRWQQSRQNDDKCNCMQQYRSQSYNSCR